MCRSLKGIISEPFQPLGDVATFEETTLEGSIDLYIGGEQTGAVGNTATIAQTGKGGGSAAGVPPKRNMFTISINLRGLITVDLTSIIPGFTYRTNYAASMEWGESAKGRFGAIVILPNVPIPGWPIKSPILGIATGDIRVSHFGPDGEEEKTPLGRGLTLQFTQQLPDILRWLSDKPLRVAILITSSSLAASIALPLDKLSIPIYNPFDTSLVGFLGKQ